jgi:predicted kinase
MAEGAAGRLIIICGLPGCGKTTVARALERRLDAIRFCPDEWMEMLSLDIYDEERRARIETLQWQIARRLLQHGLVVIIEWGTWGRSERDVLRMGARELGVAVELHYLHAPEEVLWARIRRRGVENPPITREALSQWLEKFQAPTPGELALFDPPLLADAAPSTE